MVGIPTSVAVLMVASLAMVIVEMVMAMQCIAM